MISKFRIFELAMNSGVNELRSEKVIQPFVLIPIEGVDFINPEEAKIYINKNEEQLKGKQLVCLEVLS